NIEDWRQRYPARLDFEPRRIRGEPVSIVRILQFRGGRIERETLYFADPFPAPTGAAPGPRTARRQIVRAICRRTSLQGTEDPTAGGGRFGARPPTHPHTRGGE